MKSKNNLENEKKDIKIKHDHESNHYTNYKNKFLNITFLLGSFIVLIIFLWTIFYNFDSTKHLVPKILIDPIFQFIFGTLILVFIGSKFIKIGFSDLKKKEFSEDLLVSISIIISYVFSSIIFFINISDYHWGTNVFETKGYFFEAEIEISLIIFLGRFLQDFLELKTKNNLEGLKKLFAKKANLMINENEILLKDIKEINVGDELIIYPGEKIPLDGIIIKGITEINEVFFTGENNLKLKNVGDEVFGGCISKETIIIKVSLKKEDILISKILNGIEESKNSKIKSEKITKRISRFLIPTTFIIGILTFIFYSIFILTNTINKTWYDAILAVVTIYVVACPCSFLILTPLSVTVSSTTLAKKDVIINSNKIFEKVENIDIFAFDKTGTLTKGKMEVKKSTLEEKYLRILASAESKNKHPIAKSICNFYNKNLINPKEIEVKNILGLGIEIEYKKNKYFAGSFEFLQKKGFREEKESLEKDNEIYLFDENIIYGKVVLEDELREESIELIERLRNLNKRVLMITGDNKRVALKFAKDLNIKEEDVYYGLKPIEKSKIIKKLKEEGKVAFIGDGVNDSVSLAEANIGFSMGSSSAAALESSDITIRNNNLNNVIFAINSIKATNNTIKFGIVSSIIYNFVAILLSIFGIITPGLGAALMFLNDVSTIFIATSLKRIKFIK